MDIPRTWTPAFAREDLSKNSKFQSRAKTFNNRRPRKIATFSFTVPVVSKRCSWLGPRLLLITNRKSQTRFRLITKSVTLRDLKWPLGALYITLGTVCPMKPTSQISVENGDRQELSEKKHFEGCDVTTMTSYSHVTSSVTSPFDCCWPLSYRLRQELTHISFSFRDT